MTSFVLSACYSEPEIFLLCSKTAIHKIELFYLPSYSPELNLEERLNGDLKQAIGAKVPARTKAKLKSAAIEHMTELEKDPERVMSYFQDPFVKYVAGQ